MRLLPTLPVVLCLGLSAPLAAQTTHTVQLTWSAGRGAFTPNELTIELGDTVHFDWVSGFHNVASLQGLFHSGAATTGPMTFDVVFDQAFLNAAAVAGVLGTSFDYHCEPHLAGGMVGNVTVALPFRPLLEAENLIGGGTAELTVSRATPNALVGIAYSLTGQGPTTAPGGACGPLLAELAPPFTILPAVQTDALGTAKVSQSVPPNVTGIMVYLQALDFTSCVLSNSGAWRLR